MTKKRKKNHHAAALGKLRAVKIGKKRCSEIARMGGLAKAARRKAKEAC
jgi:hypothetical protein